jgi:hypothetical protein
MAQHSEVVNELYKSKEHFDKSIWDMGWDELVIGAACYSFEDNIDHTIVDVQPENRPNAETNSINKYVGDWRVVKPVWNVDLLLTAKIVGYTARIHQLSQEIKRW